MQKKTITDNNLSTLWNKIQSYVNSRITVDSVVDLTSNQTITGKKTFSNGITIGDNVQLSYDSTEDALKISFLDTSSTTTE